jgi:hypothetical protein
MNSASRYLVGFLLVATQIPPAWAQSRRGTGAQHSQEAATADDPIIASLSNWDFNHDSIFTCANWKRYMTQLFNLADRRKRGYITPEEFETVKKADPMFANADFDYFDEQKKGRITRSDFVDRPSPFFIRYDTKHTCRVAKSELYAPAAATAVPQRRGRSGMGRSGF